MNEHITTRLSWLRARRLTLLVMTMVSTGLLVAQLASPTAAAGDARRPVRAVATFAILTDFVANVGGDAVEVVSIVGPGMDPHVYQPTPSDGRVIAGADIVFENGAGYEGWLERLISASGYVGPRVVASHGVRLRKSRAHTALHQREAGASGNTALSGGGHPHDHGMFDPHAWLNPLNGIIYVENVRLGLCEVAPHDCARFTANAADYVARVRSLHTQLTGLFAAKPGGHRIVTSHDAFGYFADVYGLDMRAVQPASTESEASARDVAAIVRQIREFGASALFFESLTDRRLIEQIARETGLKPGGTLFVDGLSTSDGPAPTYLDMVRHNGMTIMAALRARS
ncbi:MAG: metal ABC transporter solute-binding protein, Zn/Mn family [Hyphomicrobiaceae bacterium]